MNSAYLPGCGDYATIGPCVSARDPRAPEPDIDEAQAMRVIVDDIRCALHAFTRAMDRGDLDAARRYLNDIHDYTEGAEL